MRNLKYLITFLMLSMAFACSDFGKKPVGDDDNNPPDTTLSYSADIQPIFNARCSGCHVGGDQGGLRLNNFNQLMDGGDSGPVIVVSEPDSSLLIKRLEGTIQPQMPLSGGFLAQDSINLIRQWIAEGAEDN